MRILRKIVVVFFIVLLLTSLAVAALWALSQQERSRSWLHNDALVQLEQGWAQGIRLPGHSVFLGLPYAQPPVGDLRFAAPQVGAAWQGTRWAFWPKPMCAQAAVPELRVPQSLAEDCLGINVFKPVNHTGKSLPVMVWVHGGGFVLGSGNFTLASELATQGQVLVVAMNYRLGSLGFLAHPALGAENGQAVGNYGLLDQQLAIDWVRRNAAAFGADPGNITVFGQSAGGSSVCAHLMSPAMRGKFHAAIMQSPVCSGQLMQSMTDALAVGEEIAEELNCQGAGREVVDCLRRQPVAKLLKSLGKVGVTSERPLRPVYGGVVLPEAPELAFAAGHFHRVPTLIGTTKHEGSLIQALELTQINNRRAQPLTRSEIRQGDNEWRYQQALAHYFGADAVSSIMANYPVLRYGRASDALSAVLTDAIFACNAHDIRSKMAAKQVPVFAYEFAEAPNGGLITDDRSGVALGAYHGAEFSSLFYYPFYRLRPEQQALARDLKAYWSSFAHLHRPQAPGQGKSWPQFEAESGQVWTLQAQGYSAAGDFAQRHHCDFWLGLEAPPFSYQGQGQIELQPSATPISSPAATVAPLATASAAFTVTPMTTSSPAATATPVMAAAVTAASVTATAAPVPSAQPHKSAPAATATPRQNPAKR